jgi:O-antigen/teichoic acid export membrane protein
MSGAQPPEVPGDSAPRSSLELEGRILRNTGWIALGHGGRQVAAFLAMLALVRILEPADFGLVALAWAVLFYFMQIQDSGAGAALIHRRTEVEAAAASVFIFAPLASLFLYGVIFAVAPLAASFLRAPDLEDVLRVLALMLVFRGFAVVPAATLERSLDFRSRSLADMASGVVQIGASLGLALTGFGVWSLVLGHLAGTAVQSALYWVFMPRLPSLRLASRRVLLELLRYGRFVSASTVLMVMSNTLDNVVVGRMLGTFKLGLYAVAFRLADFPSSVIGFIVGRTMFSVYSMLQHDLGAFRHAYVRNLQRIALLALPVSLGIAIAAEPIVAALLGEQWLPAVPALRILAIYGMIKPFGAVSAEALKGIGKPQWNLALGILYVVVLIPALLVLTPRFGITGAAASMLIAGSVTVVSTLAVTMHAVSLHARDLARGLAPSALCSALLATALAALLVSSESMPPAASLALLVSVGFVVYLVATALFARSVIVPMWVSLRTGRQ